MSNATFRLHCAASVMLFSAAFLGVALLLQKWLSPMPEALFLLLCLLVCPLTAWAVLKAWSGLVHVPCPRCGRGLRFAFIPDWRYSCPRCGFAHDSESPNDPL